MSVVSVPQLCWYNPRPLELKLPDNWQVQVCHMNGWNRPALKPAQIKAALNKPVDTPTVKELANKLASKDATALAVQKDVINKWLTTDLETAMDYSIIAHSLCHGAQWEKKG